MTVEECYAAMGGNYADVMSRLRTDERIKKFLIKVAEDKSFELLCTSVGNGNAEDAFRAAHTLKGVCANLSITRLLDAASALTEVLRGAAAIDMQAVEPLLDNVKQVYAETVACIGAID